MKKTNNMNKPGVRSNEAAPCPEMLSVFSEPGIEIFRVTTNPEHAGGCEAMGGSHSLFTPEGWHPLMGPAAHLWIGTVKEDAVRGFAFP